MPFLKEGAFGEKNVAPEDARFVLIPVPYEKTATYRKGTAQGPAALLAASEQVELFDTETGTYPVEQGIHVAQDIAVLGFPDELAPVLERAVAPHMAAGRLVGCLGGEHSISLGPIRAAAVEHPGLGVLQIDAHPDLRDEYEGTRYGHGCVMRRVLDMPEVARVAQVGVRAVSREDRDVIMSDGRIQPFYAHGRESAETYQDDILEWLPPVVYITFDLDGFDPSVVPGTGTPEPGGLGWWEALGLVREVFRNRRVVGFDIVELLPEPPSVVSDFVAARLLFKMLAYACEERE